MALVLPPSARGSTYEVVAPLLSSPPVRRLWPPPRRPSRKSVRRPDFVGNLGRDGRARAHAEEQPSKDEERCRHLSLFAQEFLRFFTDDGL